MRNHTGVSDGRGGFGLVSSSIESRLAAEVFHLHVEDHMAGYFLIADRRRLPIREDFESDTNVFHFLGNRVSPEGIAILFVKVKGFCYGLRQIDAKFMCPFKESRASLLHEQNDTVSLFEDMGHPLVESWFAVKANNFSIFGNLNRMRFLEVSKIHP